VHDVLILLIKAVAGGGLVLLFALICQGLSPKRFSGLFSAAPAVAVAGLIVVLLDQGATSARANARGMIAGAAAMILYTLVVVPSLRRHRAMTASLTSLLAWVLAAAAVAVPVLLL
jgi:uncharacterized membrane protein (GlpM family)